MGAPWQWFLSPLIFTANLPADLTFIYELKTCERNGGNTACSYIISSKVGKTELQIPPADDSYQSTAHTFPSV